MKIITGIEFLSGSNEERLPDFDADFPCITTSLPDGVAGCTQLLHLFDPVLIAGTPESRIDRQYIRPIIASPKADLIPLFPNQDAHAAILHTLRKSFSLHPDVPGYEILLRETLSSMWLQLYALIKDALHTHTKDVVSGRVKLMMSYIHDHYAEPTSVKTLAQAAICSERECYRAFHACLHMTPQRIIYEKAL